MVILVYPDRCIYGAEEYDSDDFSLGFENMQIGDNDPTPWPETTNNLQVKFYTEVT